MAEAAGGHVDIVDKVMGDENTLLEVGEVLKMLETDQIKRSKKHE